MNSEQQDKGDPGSGFEEYDEFGAPAGEGAPSLIDRDPAAIPFLTPIGVSGWAIAAGYLGLFSVLVVPAPFAILAGIVAIRHIRQNPRKRGLPRAIFGILMGVTAAVLWLFDLAIYS